MPLTTENLSSATIGDTLTKQNQRAILHYWSLQSSLRGIAQCVENDVYSKEHLRAIIQRATVSAAVVGEYLSDRVETRIYNELNPTESMIAARALSIPELVERILSYTSIKTILKMYRVCNGLRDIIESSHALQIRLFLKVDEKSLFSRVLLDSSIDFLKVRIHNQGDAPDNPYLYFWLEFDKEGSIPKIDTRRLRMLICQPPIRRLYVSLCVKHWECKRTVITSETGFTVTELCHRAVEAKSTQPCPKCQPVHKNGLGSRWWAPHEEFKVHFESFYTIKQREIARRVISI